MVSLKNPELLRLANPLFHLFQPASAAAIRSASSPQEALLLYKVRLQRVNPGAAADPFDTHAAVFAIKAFCRLSGDLLLIPHLHAHLLKTNLFSDVYVATSLLHAYAISSLHNARLLFDEIPNRNIVTENTMISCYSNHGELTSARSIFNSMPGRDIISWSAMIAGYMNTGNWTQGLELFREMMSIGQFTPDPSALVTMLSGCAGTGSLGLAGKSIHAYAEKNGVEISEQFGTALIDMYVKSGCLRSAFRVFEGIPTRTVMHWTAMICGLAFHGYGEDAVAFFEEMKKVGVRPNEITFTGVLSACCHAGMVDEGQRYFRCMIEEFHYEPGIHHYGCMVDLFSKARRLEEAYTIIQNMKVEPNIVVWTSFLSACKNHKNFEIAEGVLERVLQMAIPDEDGGVYTLISDLYAMGGRWDSVERVREVMDLRNVKKKRGSSFIQVEN